jgi:hypothetical protein
VQQHVKNVASYLPNDSSPRAWRKLLARSGRDQAVEWFRQEGLAIAREGFRRDDKRGYSRFLLCTDR